MRTGAIRVILVDDSEVDLEILTKLLADASGIEVVGRFRSAQSALEALPRLAPDVVCTDVAMPGMDGFEFIEEIMATFPRPILVITGTVDDQRVFQLLERGAVDVLEKPTAVAAAFRVAADDLARRIRVLAGVHVVTRRRPAREGAPARRVLTAVARSAPEVVVIGASTGGPGALADVLATFPITFPAPIVCIQHISPGFLPALAQWLAGRTKLAVRIAEDGDELAPGNVMLAPDGHHFEINAHRRVVLGNGPVVDGHRPSVTVTMRSAAERFGARSCAVILTGMGVDGAAGMRAVAEAGGVTVAQDEETSLVYGMPRAAFETGVVRHVLPLDAIGARVIAEVMPHASG